MTVVNVNTPLPGYMSPVADKLLMIFDHDGPSSYTQAGNSGPVTSGGDVINAADLGVGGFDEFIVASYDSTGQLGAQVQMVGGGNGNAVPSIRLIWISRVTAIVGGQSQTAGTEVAAGTNLSTFGLRCKAWCV